MKINILRSRLLAAVLGLAMVVAVPLAVAKPAGATWACADDYVCVYPDIWYEGAYQAWYNPQPGCHNLAPQVNNLVSSAKNYTWHQVTFYDGANCTSSGLGFGPDETDSDLSGWWVWNWNDRISSFMIP